MFDPHRLGKTTAIVGALATLAVQSACSTAPNDAAPACVTGIDPACKPQYDPATYPVLFEKIFRPTCASGSGTCHTSDAAMGGLVFEDESAAYDMLLGRGSASGRARVIAGNAACSLVVERLASNDASFRMPPGPTPLLPAEICAIETWIANGAAR